MNNCFIVTPTFNDWKSLNKLLLFIDKNIKGLKRKIRILIINDCSTEKNDLNIKNLKNINSIKILNLKKNVGSQKSIYIGLKYLKKYAIDSTIVVMDSDGEDDPLELKKLINLSIKNKNDIFFASRKKRQESLFFKFLNSIRLFITYILTGKYINFGNFSAYSSKHLKKIFLTNDMWFAYSSGILKNVGKIKLISIKKKKRYYGTSKVNFNFLFHHSIKIICVFKKEIFF